MAVTHKITIRYDDGASPVVKEFSVSSEGEVRLDVPIAQNQTNLEVTYQEDVSATKSLLLLADKDCTIKTNDGSDPGATVTLTANLPRPYVATGEFGDHPFGSTDVTKLLVTTGATAGTTTLTVIKNADVTP